MGILLGLGSGGGGGWELAWPRTSWQLPGQPSWHGLTLPAPCIWNTTLSYFAGLETAVWRIRDVYPGSRIRLFTIPDPGSELSSSRIPDPHQRILTPKKAKKSFLSSKKYDPGCSSRIRMLTFSHPGSRIRIRNTAWKCVFHMQRTRSKSVFQDAAGSMVSGLLYGRPGFDSRPTFFTQLRRHDTQKNRPSRGVLL